jgi:protein-tyrosine-phosphatase/predicted ATP-grasp superfamily ATP-dependent carboligase
LPSAGKSPEEWAQHLAGHLQQEPYNLVIPTADDYLAPAVQHQEKLEKYARLAIPDQRGFTCTYNKAETLALAKSLGVPCPLTLEISGSEGFETVYKEFEFPVFVKPVSSKIWQNDKLVYLKAQLAKDRRHFEKMVPPLLKICPLLIQSYHPGIGVGQEFLMKNGQPIAVFQHERVHAPPGGGGGSYRKSVEIDPALLKHSLNLLQSLHWTGVAMVEYKYNPANRESVLMEINGRFWGSLPLAIAAGVDFPFLLYDMLVNDRVPSPVPYRKNIFCRNPVKDLRWLKENIRAGKTTPYAITVPLWRVVGEIKNILLLRERWDTITRDDPKPGVVQLKNFLAENISGAIAKIHKTLVLANYRYNPFSRWKTRRAIGKLLHKNARIAFICKGNICRSPFAHVYLNSKIAAGIPGNMRADSFGLIEPIHRPGPKNALEAAKHFGINLDAHRSKKLSPQDVETSDLLLVMDIDLYKKVKTFYPAAKKKLFYLGDLLNGEAASPEILDPYGLDIVAFIKTFSLISRSVDNLAALMKKHVPLL